MPVTVHTQIINLAAYHAQMARLETAAKGKTLENAGMEAGKVIELQAKLNVQSTFSSRQRGELAGSIHTVIAEKSENKVTVHIGTGQVYAKIQELGGLIKPVFAKFLHFFTESGEEVFAKLVQLPARPYLRPAGEQGAIRAAMAAGEVFKEAAKQAAKGGQA